MKASATSERTAVIPPAGVEFTPTARTADRPDVSDRNGSDQSRTDEDDGPALQGAVLQGAGPQGASTAGAVTKMPPVKAKPSRPDALPAQATAVPEPLAAAANGSAAVSAPVDPLEVPGPAPAAKPPDPKGQAVKLQETPTVQDNAMPSARPAEAKPQDAKTQDVKTAEAKADETKAGEAKLDEAKVDEAKVGETKVSEPRPMNGTPGMRPVLTARALAKEENFVEGDYVVYPTHGVGRVEKIAVEDIAGHRLELIHITFEENRMTLRVPVAKARTAGLRKLATQAKFDEALAVLRGRARIKRTMWSRRAQEYEAKINSGDPIAIAEVVRDLHRNAGQPDQSFSERQIYELAMDRLAAELAALDATDKVTAAAKLVNFLKAA